MRLPTTLAASLAALVLAALALGGCPAGTPTTSTTTSSGHQHGGTPPVGSGAGSAVEPGAGGTLGGPCGPNDTCAQGTCVAYRGIAGERGPEFKSCEIRCSDAQRCPEGLRCTTVADGPGSVCRAP